MTTPLTGVFQMPGYPNDPSIQGIMEELKLSYIKKSVTPLYRYPLFVGVALGTITTLTLSILSAAKVAGVPLFKNFKRIEALGRFPLKGSHEVLGMILSTAVTAVGFFVLYLRYQNYQNRIKEERSDAEMKFRTEFSGAYDIFSAVFEKNKKAMDSIIICSETKVMYHFKTSLTPCVETTNFRDGNVDEISEEVKRIKELSRYIPFETVLTQWKALKK